MAQFDFWRFGFAKVNYVPEHPPRFVDLWGAAYAHALFQPPLYYALARYVVLGLPREALIAQLYALRLFSWAIGVLNLVLVYLIGYALGKRRLGMLMLLFAALLPGHAFIQAAVINDVLAETWGLFSLLAGMLLLTRGWRPAPALVLVVSVFLGLLTKRTALVTIPWALYVLAVLLGTSARRRRTARIGLAGGTLLGVVGVVGAFYYVWTQGLLGVPRDVWEKLVTGVYWQELQRLPLDRYLITLFTSFWGHFGWLNVPLPTPVYLGLAVLTLVAALGWVPLWRESPLADVPHLKRIGPGLLLALLAQAALVFGKEVVYAYFGGQSLPQGRYLYPLLPAYALFYLLGLRPWLRRFSLPETRIWSILLLLLAVLALYQVVTVYYS